MNETQKELLVEWLSNHDEMTKSITNAVNEAVRQHKERGNSIAVWQDGRVVIVPAEEIVLSTDIHSESVLPGSSLLARQEAKKKGAAVASK